MKSDLELKICKELNPLQRIKLILLFITFSLSIVGQEANNIHLPDFKDLTLQKRIEAYSLLVDSIKHQSSEKRLQYLLLAYEEATKSSSVDTQIIIIGKVAEAYIFLGQYKTSIEYCNLGLTLSKKNSKEVSVAGFLRYIGNAYLYMGEYDRALEAYRESLEAAQKIQDHSSIAGAYNNIGLIYLQIENYDLARESFSKAERSFAREGKILNQGKAINNIGNIYFYENDYDTALEYFIKALEKFNEVNDIEQISIATNNISSIYSIKEDIENAIKYGEMATDYSIQNNDYRNIAIHSQNLGTILLEKKNDYHEAEKYFNLSKNYALKTSSLPLQMESYNNLERLYKAWGIIDSAYKYLELEFQLSDSINLLETSQKLAELESKYQLEQKEKENQLVWKYLIYISILSVLVLVAILISLWLKVRSNKMLLCMNQAIKDQNAKLEEINATKNKFFSIIAHDLMNPISTFIGFIGLIKEVFSVAPKEQVLVYIDQIGKSAEQMRALLENLLKWSRVQIGALEFSPEILNIGSIIDEVVNVFSLNATSKEITLDTHVKDGVTIYADRNMIQVILRNLVSNAIKFSPRNSRIAIVVEQKDENVVVLVKDNGVGIADEDLKKLFRVDAIFTKNGTEKEKGTGLGLILCKEFVELNGGSMIFESSPNVGSNIGFSIPRKN